MYSETEGWGPRGKGWRWGWGLPRSNFALELVEALELLLFHAVQFADSGRKDGHQVALAVHVERVEQMVQRLFRPNMFDDTIKKNVQNKKQKKNSPTPTSANGFSSPSTRFIFMELSKT